MSYTLVVGAAPLAARDDFYRALLAGATHVVAADGAGEWSIALGRVPDLVVGDFDSADPGAQDRLRAGGVEVLAFPREKDATDLEIAVDEALARFSSPVHLTAAFTDRLDHTLAALGALVRAGAGGRACEPGWTAAVCTPDAPLDVEPPRGTTVSILPIGPAEGVAVSGTAWELSGARVASLSGLGVSNEATGGSIHVSVAVGTLVIFLMDDVTGGLY